MDRNDATIAVASDVPFTGGAFLCGARVCLLAPPAAPACDSTRHGNTVVRNGSGNGNGAAGAAVRALYLADTQPGQRGLLRQRLGALPRGGGAGRLHQRAGRDW